MHEGDPMPLPADARLPIDETDPFCRQMVESGVDRRDCKRHMVEALSVAGEELADRRVGSERLQQLHIRGTHSNHRFLDSLLFHHLPRYGLHTVLPLVFGERRVEIMHGDGHMVDIDEPHLIEVTARASRRPRRVDS